MLAPLQVRGIELCALEFRPSSSKACLVSACARWPPEAGLYPVPVARSPRPPETTSMFGPAPNVAEVWSLSRSRFRRRCGDLRCRCRPSGSGKWRGMASRVSSRRGLSACHQDDRARPFVRPPAFRRRAAHHLVVAARLSSCRRAPERLCSVRKLRQVVPPVAQPIAASSVRPMVRKPDQVRGSDAGL